MFATEVRVLFNREAMTVAICLKVQDGLVLATDSASTLAAEDGRVVNIYNHADKIANPRKGLPIGLVFWGAGGIGNASMGTLAKDLRTRFNGDDPDHQDWHLDSSTYTVREVADHAREFFIDERYIEAFGEWEEKPALGIFVAGYSANSELAECYEILALPDGTQTGPDLVQPADEFGSLWRGQTEAITRLLMGFGEEMPRLLINQGIPEDELGDVVNTFLEGLEITLLHPAMPIQDTIDLADGLVDISKFFFRFLPGAQTVGGPTEIAAITKHEGFKWVKRKHYYDSRLNPPAEQEQV